VALQGLLDALAVRDADAPKDSECISPGFRAVPLRWPRQDRGRLDRWSGRSVPVPCRRRSLPSLDSASRPRWSLSRCAGTCVTTIARGACQVWDVFHNVDLLLVLFGEVAAPRGSGSVVMVVAGCAGWAGGGARPGCPSQVVARLCAWAGGGSAAGPTSLRRWSSGLVGPVWTVPTVRNRACVGRRVAHGCERARWLNETVGLARQGVMLVW